MFVQVSFIIPMHDHVSITLECLLNLLRYADEIPSAEYVLVDDGSLEVSLNIYSHTLSSINFFSINLKIL